MTAAAPAALTHEQIGALARAVSRAPSVHNSQPWQLRVRGTEIDLIERRTAELSRHDPACLPFCLPPANRAAISKPPRRLVRPWPAPPVTSNTV